MKFLDLLDKLTEQHLFFLLLSIVVAFIIIFLGFLVYIFFLLKIYVRLVKEVFSYNRTLGIPISFEYSWLRGVKIQGKPLATENKDKAVTKPSENGLMEDVSD